MQILLCFSAPGFLNFIFTHFISADEMIPSGKVFQEMESSNYLPNKGMLYNLW